jgi:chorismate mutase/prephenate dehydratase
MDQATDKNAGGLADLRERIDALDGRIVDLLNQRAAISLAVGRVKSDAQEQIFKPFREKDLLTRLVRDNPGPLPKSTCGPSIAKFFPPRGPCNAPSGCVFLGPEGTFSHLAARNTWDIRPCSHPRPRSRKSSGRERGRGRVGRHPPGELAPRHRGPERDLFMQYRSTSRPSCIAATAIPS